MTKRQHAPALGQCTAAIGFDATTGTPQRCPNDATHRAGAQRLCDVHVRGPRIESARVLHPEPFEAVRF